MELFLEACDATGLTLDVAHHERWASTRHSLRQPFALIGREHRADVCLTDPDVRRRHVYIHSIAGRVLYINLQSPQDPEQADQFKRTSWIESSACIRVGSYDIRLVDGDDNGAAGAIAARDRFKDYLDQLPEVTARISELDGKSLRCTMRGVVVLLGSATGGAVGLVSRTVSHVHCILIRTPSGVWVVDLLGRGGTWVNGTPVRFARLEEGDRLALGKFLVEVSYETAPQRLRQGSNSFHPHRTERSTSEDGESRVTALVTELGGDIGIPVSAAPVPGLPELLKSGASLPSHPDTGRQPGVHSNQLISQEQLLQVLTPFASQLRLMQEQMFDQFQQSMLTMFEMFSSLHREQASAVRREIDDLKRVTREIEELRKEMKERSIPISQPVSVVPFDKLPPITVATLSFDSSEPPNAPGESSLPGNEHKTHKGLERPSNVPHPAEISPQSSLKSEAVYHTTPPDMESTGQVERTAPEPAFEAPKHRTDDKVARVSQESPRGHAAQEPKAAAVDASAKGKATLGATSSDPSIHDWLSHRMAELQKEQQSHWQRLVRLLTGR
jgi:pSer/pThr/pTyr-binding forkhead associated (FHA) protein